MSMVLHHHHENWLECPSYSRFRYHVYEHYKPYCTVRHVTSASAFLTKSDENQDAIFKECFDPFSAFSLHSINVPALISDLCDPQSCCTWKPAGVPRSLCFIMPATATSIWTSRVSPTRGRAQKTHQKHATDRYLCKRRPSSIWPPYRLIIAPSDLKSRTTCSSNFKLE